MASLRTLVVGKGDRRQVVEEKDQSNLRERKPPSESKSPTSAVSGSGDGGARTLPAAVPSLVSAPSVG